MTNKNNSVEKLAETFAMQIIHSQEGFYFPTYEEVLSKVNAFRSGLIQEIREKIPTLRESQNCGKCYSCEMASPCEIRFADREVNQTLFGIFNILDELEGNK